MIKRLQMIAGPLMGNRCVTLSIVEDFLSAVEVIPELLW